MRISSRYYGILVTYVSAFIHFYTSFLSVSTADNGGEYVGCYKDSRDTRLLNGAHIELKDNSPTNCINFCIMTGE